MSKQKLTQIRQEAARLARTCRKLRHPSLWSIKQWNDQVRATIRHYIENSLRAVM